MTLNPARWHQITTRHEHLRHQAENGWTPTHREVLQLLADGDDLIRDHINRRNP